MQTLLELLPQLRADLSSAADPDRAPGMQAYMKGVAPFLGVSAPHRRGVQRPLLLSARSRSADELLDFADACWDQPEREFQYVAVDLLRKGVGGLRSSDLGRITHLLRTKPWWDTIDPLAAWVVGPLVLADPALVNVMDAWINDDNFWVARTAILHQLSFAARTDAARLFGYTDQRAADTEFFVRKALGWALRQYARVAPNEVRSYVESRGSVLSGLTRREALKHLV
jgi:3-methyladenine DNA glycosylase AlkD